MLADLLFSVEGKKPLGDAKPKVKPEEALHPLSEPRKKKKKNKINRNHMAGHLLQLKALTLHTGHVLRHMETSPPSTVQGCPHAAGSPFSFPCRASLGNHYRGLPTQVLCEVLEKRHPAITLGPLRCGHACESGNPVHSWYEAPIPDVSGMNIIPQLFLISLQIEN